MEGNQNQSVNLPSEESVNLTSSQNSVSSVSTLPTQQVVDNGLKTAIIAVVINIILTFIFLNTHNFNVLLSGIYLGVSRGVGRLTKVVFYVISFVFFFIDEGFVENGFVDVERGMGFGIFVTFFSCAMLAALPLGVMWIVRKIGKV